MLMLPRTRSTAVVAFVDRSECFLDVCNERHGTVMVSAFLRSVRCELITLLLQLGRLLLSFATSDYEDGYEKSKKGCHYDGNYDACNDGC